MTVTMASTRKDSSRMANAGVDTGANMLGVGATTATARRKLSLLRACSEGGAAAYVPSRPFFSKNTKSADGALLHGGERALPALQSLAVRRPIGWRSDRDQRQHRSDQASRAVPPLPHSARGSP